MGRKSNCGGAAAPKLCPPRLGPRLGRTRRVCSRHEVKGLRLRSRHQMGTNPVTDALGRGGRGTGGRERREPPARGPGALAAGRILLGSPQGSATLLHLGPALVGPVPERTQRCGLQPPAVGTGRGSPGQLPAPDTHRVCLPRAGLMAGASQWVRKGLHRAGGQGLGGTPLNFSLFVRFCISDPCWRKVPAWESRDRCRA